MAVYREYQVSIPASHVTRESQGTGKPVLVKYVLQAPYNREKGYPEPKRTTIGHQVPGSKTMMYPTTQYKQVFPDEWEKISHEKVLPAVKHIGLFTAFQAVNTKTGIKDMLDEVYGVEDADAIMDFVMYSVLDHSDTAQVFEERMRKEMLYSSKSWNDSDYSALFEHRMSREQELQFKKKWALHCKDEGVAEVWLCIDGSNDDCKSKGVEIAEKGHPKSGKNVNIVSFTYAVTPDGQPVTWETYQGGLVDSKALKMIIDFLKECGIKVTGVILDRGYCDGKAVQYLIDQKLAYVIMIKGNPAGYDKVVDTFGNKIKMNAEYLVEGTYLFGIQQRIQLFSGLSHLDYVTLFFDYQNGGERITTLLKNLYEAEDKVRAQIKAGEIPSADKKYKPYIQIRGNKVSLNKTKLQTAIDEKGLYGIVTSKKMTPSDVHQLYSSRDASEVQFRTVKTQLGYGKIRVYYTAGVRAKFEIGFIAAVVRHEMEEASKDLNRTTNQMILETDRLEMQKLNDVYTYTHTETARLLNFMKSLSNEKDITELINESVKFENDRQAGRAPMPRHRKTGPKKGSHHKKYDENGNVIRKKSGVKPGTKRSDVNADGTPRKKPGVQVGTVRGKYNKDGSLRKKPGPKPGSHHSPETTA